MRFTDPAKVAHVDDPLWADVSCLARVGRSLFCSCDETATVERLTLDPDGATAAEHLSVALGEVFDLPEGPAGEMDVEGVAVDDGWLWVCGSHSLKRGKPGADDLGDLADVRWDANRGFLGRLPLIDRGEGLWEPVAAIDAADGRPARRAAMLPMVEGPKTALRRLLAKDPLVGPFVNLPAKEGGLDVEGLAARGETALIGLRGPVVGEHALIVRLDLKAKGDRLKPRKLGDGRRWSVQALDLAGHGVRDLCWDGDTLYVLTGATTGLDSLQSVVAIDAYDPDRPLYPADAIRAVLHLRPMRGADHAEGLAIVEGAEGRRLLVTYDSPHGERTDPEDHALIGDIFTLDA